MLLYDIPLFSFYVVDRPMMITSHQHERVLKEITNHDNKRVFSSTEWIKLELTAKLIEWIMYVS